MSVPKLTEREVRFARSFLHYAKANEQNTYLLLAVIAWMRQESGQTYLGNNPFNIRNSVYASGYRQTRNGNGHFAIFATLDAAAHATVAFLISNATFGHYGPILAAMRRGTGGDKGVTQALDFLTAIAVSKWDASHYGAADGNAQNNHLVRVWAGLTGAKIPASWYKDTKKVVHKHVIPRQPRSLAHTMPTVEYISPYGAARFYDAVKHFGQFILPQEDA